jgi:uncharacterized membrane protein YphA (DoxX/SURF4 family)
MTDTRTAPFAVLLLRIALGLFFLAHGLVKIFVFTIPGFVQFFGSIGYPEPVAYLVLLAELAGGLALIVGLWTRWSALILCAEMMRFPVSVRRSPLPWSPASPIRGHSARPGISQPGSGSCPGSTRAEAKTSSAASASKGIATCGACLQRARSPSFAMPRFTAPNIALGSRRCWRVGRPRLPRSPWRTRSPEWLGP